MKITSENIHTLKPGTKVWVAKSFNIPDNVVYMGEYNDGVLSSRYAFIGDGDSSFTIFKKNPNHNHNLSLGNLFTTYDECCVRMREQCLDTIDHFNAHQLKKNPIVVSTPETPLFTLNDLIAAYSNGYGDRDSKLAAFNGQGVEEWGKFVQDSLKVQTDE